MNNDKEENKKIRLIWNKAMDEMFGDSKSRWNIFYYNDKRKGGRRRCFKSYGWVGWEEVWKEVLKRLESEGIKDWNFYEGCSFRGDGSVSGIFKKGV